MICGSLFKCVELLGVECVEFVGKLFDFNFVEVIDMEIIMLEVEDGKVSVVLKVCY